MEENEINRYDAIKKSFGSIDDLEKLVSQRSHAAGAVSDSADSKFRNQIFKLYQDHNGLQEGEAEPRNLSGERLESGEGAYKEIERKKAGNHLYAHPEETISQIPEKTLETLVKQQIIQSEAKGDDAKSLQSYLTYTSLEALSQKVEKGERPGSEEEQELIQNYAKKGLDAYKKERIEEAKKKEIERQEKEGYTDKRLIEIAGSLAGVGVDVAMENKGAEKQKKFILDGLKEDMEKNKKKYEEMKEEGKDIYTAVRNVLKTLAAEKNPGRFQMALDAIYAPEKLDSKYLRQAA